ncbi:MAG: hypothetical protein AAFQ63_10760 [Cyanobacteria bacterium J06621_11]
MPANNQKNRVPAANDEPSPFVEDRPGFNPNKQASGLSKSWLWLVALATVGIVVFFWTQRPASTPTKSAPTETQSFEGSALTPSA